MPNLFFALLIMMVLKLALITAKESCAYIDYIGKEFNISDIECSSNSICNENRVISISYIEFPPYFYPAMKVEEPSEHDVVEQRPIEQIMRRCCGSCVKFKDVHIFKNLSEVTLDAIKTSDFVYPFFASSSTEMLYGYHYLPFVDAPQMVYITEKKGPDAKALVLRVLPVSIICVLMAVISGFVCWLLETWDNREEFSRPFLIGWFEGFWWSFVSITTVGYGDKTPKSFSGRIFSVLWISVGIIAYALPIGIVYAEVMKINSPDPPSMKEANVGSLLYRDYDAYMIAANGGKLYLNMELQVTSFEADVLYLIDRLQQEQLDGFVMDKYTLWTTTFVMRDLLADMLHDPSLQNKWKPVNDPVSTINFFMKKTMTTPVNHNGAEQLTYGALVKDRKDYDFLKHSVKDKRFRDQASMSIIWSYLEDYVTRKKDENALFSFNSYSFQTFVKWAGCVISGILLIGLIFDLKRTKFRLKEILSFKKDRNIKCMGCEVHERVFNCEYNNQRDRP